MKRTSSSNRVPTTGKRHKASPDCEGSIVDISDDELELPQTFEQDISVEEQKRRSAKSLDIPNSIPFLGTPAHGRTVSVALPASIVANAQVLIH